MFITIQTIISVYVLIGFITIPNHLNAWSWIIKKLTIFLIQLIKWPHSV